MRYQYTHGLCKTLIFVFDSPSFFWYLFKLQFLWPPPFPDNRTCFKKHSHIKFSMSSRINEACFPTAMRSIDSETPHKYYEHIQLSVRIHPVMRTKKCLAVFFLKACFIKHFFCITYAVENTCAHSQTSLSFCSIFE